MKPENSGNKCAMLFHIKEVFYCCGIPHKNMIKESQSPRPIGRGLNS